MLFNSKLMIFQYTEIHVCNNPFHDKFSLEDMKKCQQFISFLHTDMTEVVEKPSSC